MAVTHSDFKRFSPARLRYVSHYAQVAENATPLIDSSRLVASSHQDYAQIQASLRWSNDQLQQFGLTRQQAVDDLLDRGDELNPVERQLLQLKSCQAKLFQFILAQSMQTNKLVEKTNKKMADMLKWLRPSTEKIDDPVSE
jgi:hypothetical protein